MFSVKLKLGMLVRHTQNQLKRLNSWNLPQSSQGRVSIYVPQRFKELAKTGREPPSVEAL